MSKRKLAIGTVNNILKLHARGWSVNQIVHRTQVSAQRVKETLAEHGLRPLKDAVPKPPPSFNRHKTNDPTPEEIAEITAEIRARWSEATERSRNQHAVDDVMPHEWDHYPNRKPKHDHNQN